MAENTPFVSVIIPCRNEEKFIGQCLDSLIKDSYPKEKLEILAVDGKSQDKTREIIEKYAGEHSFIRLLDNPKKITPVSMNMGIKNSKGSVIMIMGAHANYSNDYVAKCVKALFEYNADCVGGAMKVVTFKNTLTAKAIAGVLASFFGTGNSYFKIDYKKVKYVDALFGSCYKREVFDRIGMYNENLVRSQDIEFSLRLKRAGGKILLVPDIENSYYPVYNIADFAKHNFIDGIWATYPLRFSKTFFSMRHYMPLVFILFIIFLLIFWRGLFLPIAVLYVLATLYFSLKIALKEKNLEILLITPVIFFIRHFFYGLGSIIGLLKIVWEKT